MNPIEKLRAEAAEHAKAIADIIKATEKSDEPKLTDAQKAEIARRNKLIDEVEAKLEDAVEIDKLRQQTQKRLDAQAEEDVDVDDETALGFMAGGPKGGKKGKVEPQGKNGPGSKPGDLFTMTVQAAIVGKMDHRSPYEIAGEMYGQGFVDTIKAAQVGSDAQKGGFLVPPNFVQDFIELLRPASLVRRAGATVLNITGPTPIPGMGAGTTGEWVAEAGKTNAQTVKFNQRSLNPKEVMSIVAASNKLLRRSDPSALALLQQDLVAGIAQAEDAAFLRGAGTDGTPKGIRYWAAAVTASGGAWSTLSNMTGDLRGLRTRLASGMLGNQRRPTWLMNDDMKIEIGDRRNATTEMLIFPSVEGDSRLYGAPIQMSYQVPNNLGGGGNEHELYYVDMAEAVIGQELSVQVDTSDSAAFYDESGTLTSTFSRNLTVIRAVTSVDFLMRRDEAAQVVNGITFA